MRLILFFALTIGASAASAQTIYKCKGAKGAVSYQTDPCGPGAKVAAVKSYERVPDDPAATYRLRQTEAAMAARAEQQRSGNFQPGSVQTYGPRDQQRAACAQARAYRESTLRNVGLNRTYELLKQLDAQVNRACQGV